MIKRFKKRQAFLLLLNLTLKFHITFKASSLLYAHPFSFYEKYLMINDFPKSNSCSVFDAPFNNFELSNIIKNLKTRSSPGLDKISYDLISLLPNSYHPLLLDIFNNLLEEGTFPESWHHSLVFLIPKNNSNKYRPISLTSCCLKLLEKLILSRLDWWIEKNHLLPKCQFGFRKNKSCQDNIAILTTEIYNGFISRQSTACVFLDIVGAFDNVIPNILLSDLIKLGLPPKICLFVYNLIKYRKLQFVIHVEISEPYFSYKGVPQGSILSPLLFNIYVAKCKNHIDKKCEIIQFADDTAIFIKSSNLIQSLQLLESSANNLTLFLQSRGLDISPTKSALIVFSRSRKKSHFILYQSLWNYNQISTLLQISRDYPRF